MPKRVYVRCNPFFSLPQFSQGCRLVRNTDLVLRNILLCNPNDQLHLKFGVIPDPFIEGDESGNPLYIICEGVSRRAFEREKNNYDELYLVFRTNYISLDGNNEQIIPGFYYVEDFRKSKYGPIVVASRTKSKFIAASDALKLSRKLQVNEYIKKHNLYRTSFYRYPHREKLLEWLDALRSNKMENKLDEYQKESKRLVGLFEKYAPTGENYPACSSCVNSMKEDCPLEKRKKVASIGLSKQRISEEPKKSCQCGTR